MFSLFVLIGCTSKNYSSIETDFISFLPSGADIYLRYPVQQNLKLSQEILTIFAPTMSKKNVNQLLKRLDTLYISIKGHQINAIASGSFPSFALGIIFKEKNGWKKIKDDSIPITKKYYSSVESNFQIAFPNQSVVLISKNVTDLLKNYEKSYFNPPDFTEQDLFPFSKSNISGVIDFSFPNFTNLLQAEIKGFNFKFSYL